MDDWLTGLTAEARVFEEAGRSVGLEVTTIRVWVREIVGACRATPPRVVLLHNDLLANHVFVHDGHLSGIIDFGEALAHALVLRDRLSPRCRSRPGSAVERTMMVTSAKLR